MKYRHIVAGLILVSGLLCGWILTTGSGAAQTASDPNALCPSGISITQPLGGATVGGIVTLEATTYGTLSVQSVSFVVKDTFTYSGQRSDPYWRVPFDTRNPDLGGNGAYTVRAKVIMANTTGVQTTCSTAQVNFNVYNPPAPAAVSQTLEVASSLQSWTGPTNVSFDVVLKVTQVSGTTRTDVTPQAAYDWSVTKGVLRPLGHRANVNSGPTVGEGYIRVRIMYGGQVKELSIPMRVQPASETTSYPTAEGGTAPSTSTTNTASPTGTPTATTGTSEQPKTLDEAKETGLFQTALSRNGQGDAELERCLSHTLGQAQYAARIKLQPRLNFDELERSQQCIVRRNSVLPANLAPIEPAKVADLKVDKKVKLEKFERITQDGKDALQLSGTARPNQTVVIYIFSEPLVLVAKADDAGRWTYVLEDPMEPGDHQAFVTVEGDGETPAVRSAGFGFAIATAAKSKLNPYGLSFDVQNVGRTKLFYASYVGGAVIFVAIAMLLILLVIRRRIHATAHVDSASDNSSETPSEPQQPVSQ